MGHKWTNRAPITMADVLERRRQREADVRDLIDKIVALDAAQAKRVLGAEVPGGVLSYACPFTDALVAMTERK